MIRRLTVLVFSFFVSTAGWIGTAATAQEPGPPEALRAMERVQASVPILLWREDGKLAVGVRGRDGIRWRAVDPGTEDETAMEGPPEPVDGPALACEPEGGEGETEDWCTLRVVRPGLFADDPPVREVVSPDGRWLAGVREGDVWVRAAARRDSARLTTEGTPEFGYDVEGAKWSPDGRLLALRRMDRRGVPTIPIVRWGEPGAPVERRPYSRVGQPIPDPELHVVDREGGGSVHVELGEGEAPYVHVVGWSEDGSALYVLRMSRLMDRLELLEADPETGATRTLLVETSETFIGGLPFLQGYADDLDAKNHVVFLGDGEGFVWTSERDGWRRLYLYDGDGELVRPLTPTRTEVIRLEAVDPEGGRVYYSARPDPEDPHAEALLRAPIEGGEPERLVDGPVLEDLALGPRGEFLWVLRGGLEGTPTAELRRADGTPVRTVWSAAGLLDELPTPEPEPFTATAADGETALHGMIFRPSDFVPSRSYPVVEMIYGGPNVAVVPRSPLNPFLWVHQALADAGFVVVSLDGRGTPGRGKAFQDAFHGRIGQGEIADHAAALRQAAADRPWMDLDRVGVMGHSWGGYFALRALLTAAGLYRVGVASAPAVDLEDFRVAVEPYMGCLPENCPEAYRAGSNTRLLDRLQGELLLLHGTADRDVPVGETLRLADALNGAGMRYDLVLFPGSSHGIPGNPTWWMRTTGFLTEALGVRTAESSSGAADLRPASSPEAAPAPSPEPARDTAEVLAAARSFLTAFNRLDWEPFHGSFDPSATVFQPFGEPFRNDGPEEVAAFFRGFFDRVRAARDGPPYLEIEPDDLRIDPIGEAAVVTFHLPGEEQVGRRTLVFGRDAPDAPWRIAHLHASTLERPGAGGEGAGAPSRQLEAGQAQRYAGRYTLSHPEAGGMTLTFRVDDDGLEVDAGGDVRELSYLGGHVFRDAAAGFLFVFDVDRDGRATGVTGLPRELDRPGRR